MRPGDTAYLVVTVTDSGGTPITGLVTGDFTVAGFLSTTTPAVSFTAAELGSGRYRLAIVLPAVPGWLTLLISSSTRVVDPPGFDGELQAQDLDSVYAAAVVARVTIGGITRFASSRQLELIAYRYTQIDLQVTDQIGAPVDLSGFNNWRFTVRDKLHADTPYTLTSGITGSAEGALAFAIPENATFFAAITAAIAAGNDTATLYYDVTADAAATAAQSQTIVRGQITIHRYESAAS